MLALYCVLGVPDGDKVHDPISWDKFTNQFTHRRQVLGWVVDSRELLVSLPTQKKEFLIDLLRKWLTTKEFSLKEIAELVGLLVNTTTVNRGMRCSYFVLQSTLSRLLMERYHKVKGFLERRNRSQEIEAQLNSETSNQVGSDNTWLPLTRFIHELNICDC